jgi:DNA-binding PadR family transcriptional regulator
MELLVLSSLARRPMHGYDIKLELQYKHVRWWARCDHGHLYGTLNRLERDGLIRAERTQGGRKKKVFAITEVGRERMEAMLARCATDEDATRFDVDLFVSGSFALPKDRVLALLAEREHRLDGQLAEARALVSATEGKVPLAGTLIMAHRLAHLEREVAFARACAEAFADVEAWRPYLGGESIGAFLERVRAPLEGDSTTRSSTTRS